MGSLPGGGIIRAEVRKQNKNQRKDEKHAEILKSKKTLYPCIKLVSVFFAD